MGFFDSKNSAKKGTSAAPPTVVSQPITPNGKSTYISPRMTLNGDTVGEDDLIIAGTVKGTLECGRHITVEATGRVEAKIRCKSITIRGEVTGNVDASEEITIEASGKLIGDITAKVFTNQPGGFFEGYSHMLKDAPDRSKHDQTMKGAMDKSKHRKAFNENGKNKAVSEEKLYEKDEG